MTTTIKQKTERERERSHLPEGWIFWKKAPNRCPIDFTSREVDAYCFLNRISPKNPNQNVHQCIHQLQHNYKKQNNTNKNIFFERKRILNQHPTAYHWKSINKISVDRIERTSIVVCGSKDRRQIGSLHYQIQNKPILKYCHQK